MVFAGAVFAANISAYAWAVHLTSVANASLLSNLAPIFVSLASFLLFGERVSRGFIAAMIAAIVGVTILVGDKLGIDRGQILGDGLGVFSSLAFAGYLMAIGRLRLRQRSSTVMAASVVVTALCLLLQALATGERLLPRTIYGWADLLALALVSHALGQGLLTVALAHVSATFSAVSLLTLPVTAAFYGWVFFREPLSLNQAIGAPVVLASILAARLAMASSGRGCFARRSAAPWPDRARGARSSPRAPQPPWLRPAAAASAGCAAAGAYRGDPRPRRGRAASAHGQPGRTSRHPAWARA